MSSTRGCAWRDLRRTRQPERATELRAKAAALYARFNEAFWDEELGFYAYALDGEKKKVLSVASNAGHCLWSGIVPPERAKRVVERLMAPDMWTGWGIRTLSADHRAFNPYNYQTGSVWPHDNAIIAMGFKFYGFAAEAARIAHDVSVAASHFLLNQLPELYTASERTESNFPCNISVPTCRKPGRPARCSCSRRHCSDSCRTRRATSSMLIHRFPLGCLTSPCGTCAWVNTSSIYVSGAKAERPTLR